MCGIVIAIPLHTQINGHDKNFFLLNNFLCLILVFKSFFRQENAGFEEVSKETTKKNFSLCECVLISLSF